LNHEAIPVLSHNKHLCEGTLVVRRDLGSSLYPSNVGESWGSSINYCFNGELSEVGQEGIGSSGARSDLNREKCRKPQAKPAKNVTYRQPPRFWLNLHTIMGRDV